MKELLSLDFTIYYLNIIMVLVIFLLLEKVIRTLRIVAPLFEKYKSLSHRITNKLINKRGRRRMSELVSLGLAKKINYILPGKEYELITGRRVGINLMGRITKKEFAEAREEFLKINKEKDGTEEA